MSEFGLTEEERGMIRKAFLKFGADANQVFVFGSRAKGTHRKGSDIDLAYKGELSSEQLLKIKDYLEEETFLPYMFDIVLCKSIENPSLKEHIDRVGKVL